MSSGKPYTLHTGKAEEVLLEYPDNHFDSCITDGPYGIRFMGKAWDGADIEKTIASKMRKGTTRPSGRSSVENRAWAAGEYDVSLTGNQKFQEWFYDKATHIFRVLKPGGYFVSFGSPRTFHRMVCGVEDAGFEIRDTIIWLFSSGFPKSHNLDGEFEGWGTALKPAYEPILIARKPLIGTVKKNMETYGTGAINIKDCLIEGEPWHYGSQPKLNGAAFNPGQDTDGVHATNVEGGQDGRWPANFIHDGSEEVLAAFPDAPGQMAKVGPENGDRPSINTYGDYGPRPTTIPRQEQNKSASRFFYVAKTSRADRNEGCEHLDDKPLSWSSGTKNPGSFQGEGTKKSSPNSHPTVKPTMLMRYLCKLFTRKDGLILDPFAGSGSTGKAAMYEHQKFVGIDQDPQWLPVQQARIEYALRNRDNQIGIPF